MDVVVNESKLAFLINVLKDNIYRIAHMLGFKNWIWWRLWFIVTQVFLFSKIKLNSEVGFIAKLLVENWYTFEIVKSRTYVKIMQFNKAKFYVPEMGSAYLGLAWIDEV